jgi:hypothetical protein
MSTYVNAQIIDPNHFAEERMNEIMVAKMSNYTLKNYSYPIVLTNIGKGSIYRLIRRNCEKLSLDNLNVKINKELLSKWDSRAISQTNQVGNVGLIDSVSCQNFKTYQEIADYCITGWLHSENLIFMRWSQIGEAVSFYNQKNQVVYIFWAYYN